MVRIPGPPPTPPPLPPPPSEASDAEQLLNGIVKAAEEAAAEAQRTAGESVASLNDAANKGLNAFGAIVTSAVNDPNDPVRNLVLAATGTLLLVTVVETYVPAVNTVIESVPQLVMAIGVVAVAVSGNDPHVVSAVNDFNNSLRNYSDYTPRGVYGSARATVNQSLIGMRRLANLIQRGSTGSTSSLTGTQLSDKKATNLIEQARKLQILAHRLVPLMVSRLPPGAQKSRTIGALQRAQQYAVLSTQNIAQTRDLARLAERQRINIAPKIKPHLGTA